jgi:aryl-alcohol dehydrogenase-like predicted oxidoreductase
MNQRILGKTGISVSEIGIGAWQLGGPLMLDGKMDGHPDLGRDFVIDLIRRLGSELGINFIDSAEQYGAGESERRVGDALLGQRDRWVISTKFGAFVGDVTVDPVTHVPSGKRVNDASAKRVAISLEGSLRRLKTDRIDIYCYHVGPDVNEADGVARVLESARKKGQIRAIGISTVHFSHIEFLLKLGLDVVQFYQNMAEPQEQMTNFIAEHQLGGVVRGAFAGGRLSGKYFAKAPAFSPEDIRNNKFKADTRASDFAKFKVFEELVTKQRSMPQLALRWLLDLPTTHTIILGAKSFGEYQDAAGATKLPRLSDGEQARIAELRRQVAAAK